MIELKFTGKCEGCTYADLELVPVALGKKKLWGVRCIHDYACEAMLTKSFNNQKETKMTNQRDDFCSLGERKDG